MPKRPTLPQKTSFSPLILFSRYANIRKRKHSHTQTLCSGKHFFYFKSTQSFAWVRTEIEIFHPRNPFTALEQKRLELRSLSPALPYLWFLLVTCISQRFLAVNPLTAYVEARFGTTCDIPSFSTQKWLWSTTCESFLACANDRGLSNWLVIILLAT